MKFVTTFLKRILPFCSSVISKFVRNNEPPMFICEKSEIIYKIPKTSFESSLIWNKFPKVYPVWYSRILKHTNAMDSSDVHVQISDYFTPQEDGIQLQMMLKKDDKWVNLNILLNDEKNRLDSLILEARLCGIVGSLFAKHFPSGINITCISDLFTSTNEQLKFITAKSIIPFFLIKSNIEKTYPIEEFEITILFDETYEEKIIKPDDFLQ